MRSLDSPVNCSTLILRRLHFVDGAIIELLSRSRIRRTSSKGSLNHETLPGKSLVGHCKLRCADQSPQQRQTEGSSGVEIVLVRIDL